MITQNDLKKIENYMYNKTRDLELAIYNSLIDDDDELNISYALSMYQNKDGGFANGLNPNLMVKESSPYETIFALEIVNKYKNIDEFTNKMVEKAINYLEKRINTFKALPNLSNYPHAKWLEESNLDQTYLIYTYKNILFFKSPRTLIYKTILEKTKNEIDSFLSNNYSDLSLIKAFELLFEVMKSKKIDYRLFEFEEKIKYQLSLVIETDETKWKINSRKMPINLLTPYFETFFSTERSLDFIIKNRTFLGTWDFEYTYGTNDEDDDVARIKWAGIITVWYLSILISHKRILVI